MSSSILIRLPALDLISSTPLLAFQAVSGPIFLAPIQIACRASSVKKNTAGPESVDHALEAKLQRMQTGSGDVLKRDFTRISRDLGRPSQSDLTNSTHMG
jgi:hypothetical protein